LIVRHLGEAEQAIQPGIPDARRNAQEGRPEGRRIMEAARDRLARALGGSAVLLLHGRSICDARITR
jgi:hypothetical protein